MDEEPNADIFQNLDRDLMDIFQEQQLAAFFRTVPLERHDERLNQLNQLIGRSHRLQTNDNHESPNRYVKLVWFLNFIPLPVVKYRRIWRDVNGVQAAWRLLTFVIINITRIFRFAMFLVGSSFYLQRIARTLFLFGNEITFSTNFFNDVLTYLLRYNTWIFHRFEVIQTNGIRFSLGLDGQLTIGSFIEFVKRFFIHTLILQIRSVCENSNGEVTCGADDSSLIFKFDQIFRSKLPNLNENYLTLLVVTIYLSYALIGNMICMNISYLYSVNIFNRFMKYSGYYSGLFRAVWKASADLI